uniref:Sigma70_r4 domain-containing protein n=1 Tax=Macrostomum lignano TaxID=282301 RepID=A0A1I8H9A9_9PLAT
MASKAKQQPIKIINAIKSISSKDTASTAIAIAAISEEEQTSLFEVLRKVDQASATKERTEDAKRSENNKERREARFMARLKESLNNIRNEKFTVRTRFFDAKKLCMADVQGDEESMRRQFNDLQVFVKDLEVLGCLARRKQAEVLATLKKKLGVTTETVAKRLDIGIKFAERLCNFNSLISKFPNLVFSGYSFESLLTFKTVIEREAAQDENL